MKEKIIIFGGAFNPPHNEHVLTVEKVKNLLKCDKALILPSYFPPHKNGAKMVDFELRKTMCNLAFPCDTICDIEQKLDQKSYALNTVRALKKIYANAEFYYALGGDSMADFFKWYKPEELLREVTLVVYPRENSIIGSDESIKKATSLGSNIIKVDSVGQNISSGEIRCLLSLGVDLSSFIPSKVYDFIKEKDLYKSELVDYVRGKVSPKTFEHSLRTCIWALELNRKIGLNPQIVFESAILHDVEKNSLSENGVPIDALNTPVAHQFAGAERVKELGLSDEVQLAIKYHTTAKPNMSPLEMLIYSADMTEKGRDFEGVDELRKMLQKDLLGGFIACLRRSYEYLLSKNKEIYHLTKEAYQFYC